MTETDGFTEGTLLDEWRDALEESAQHYDPAAQARIVTETLLEVTYDDDTPLWQVCIDAAGRMLPTGIHIENASSGPLELVHIELPDGSKRHEVRIA